MLLKYTRVGNIYPTKTKNLKHGSTLKINLLSAISPAQNRARNFQSDLRMYEINYICELRMKI